ncbi:ATP-binding protein [soil metagenome]
MHDLIRESARETNKLPYTPFMLDSRALGEPTEFQLDFLLDDVRHQYGFAFDAGHIQSEWLLAWPKKRPRVLIDRTGTPDSGSWFGDSVTGPNKAVARITRANALLLSTSALLDHPTMNSIHEAITSMFFFAGSKDIDIAMRYTVEGIFSQPRLRDNVLRLMKEADLGISGLEVEEPSQPDEQSTRIMRTVMTEVNPEISEEELNEAMQAFRRPQPWFVHSGHDRSTVRMPLDSESVGTRNFLALSGPILASLEHGGILVVDEIDTSLHPRLVSEIVRLFQSSASNARQAQVILSTHDVTLMMNAADYHVLDRDQIWFVEKDSGGASCVYPLSDFKPRQDEVYSRHYLQGRYGAVPAIDEGVFETVFGEVDDDA